MKQSERDQILDRLLSPTPLQKRLREARERVTRRRKEEILRMKPGTLDPKGELPDQFKVCGLPHLLRLLSAPKTSS